MRPKDLPHGVAQPRPSTSSGAAKVTGILMEQGGEDGLCHIVPNYEIAIRRAHIPSESRAPCPKDLLALVNWPKPPKSAANATVPRSPASSVAILNFCRAVSGSYRIELDDVR